MRPLGTTTTLGDLTLRAMPLDVSENKDTFTVKADIPGRFFVNFTKNIKNQTNQVKYRYQRHSKLFFVQNSPLQA
jgi:hypothetical protein